MITQEYLVGDLELRLTKSKPSSDTDLTYEQLAYWIDQARDEVTKAIIDQEKRIDDSVIIEIKDLVPYDVSGSYFIDLSLVPLDLKHNKGIVYVKNSSGDYILGQSIANKRFLSKLPFTKPTNCNIVYSLSGSALQIEGSPEAFNFTYSIGLVHSELSRTKLPSDKYYVLPSSVETILELAEQIGIRELNGEGFYDITGDGISNN